MTAPTAPTIDVYPDYPTRLVIVRLSWGDGASCVRVVSGFPGASLRGSRAAAVLRAAFKSATRDADASVPVSSLDDIDWDAVVPRARVVADTPGLA